MTAVQVFGIAVAEQDRDIGPFALDKRCRNRLATRGGQLNDSGTKVVRLGTRRLEQKEIHERR